MSKKRFELKDVDLIVKKYLIPILPKFSILTFSGSLGAGKTTLIKELLSQVGVNANVTSPTFNYVNDYKNKKGELFHHFDLYRIETLNDFLSTGFDEYLYESDSWCLVEWPRVIVPLLEKEPLKSKWFNVFLEHDEESPDYRIIELGF